MLTRAAVCRADAAIVRRCVHEWAALENRPVPAAAIGECDWCGVIDHHLIEGECPACRERAGRGESNG